MKPEPIREAPIELTRLSDGRIQFTLSADWAILGGELPDEILEMTKPGSLHVKVTPPRRKVFASKWFLNQLRKCLHNEPAALMFLEALVSELRATTFTLQSLLNSRPGFTTWYEQQQQEMRADEKLRWLVDARNTAQKEGMEFTSWGAHLIAKFPRNAKVYGERLPPTLKISGLNRAISVSELEQIAEYLNDLVEKAHEQFYVPTDKKHEMILETVREREDGTWEHFDLG